jgi:hypothetical protein
MNKSESILKISVALLKAQKKIQSVTKDASNPYFKSKYADLASVINACKDELNSEGITVLQPVDEMYVETCLLHESGEYMSALTPIVCKSQNNPQDLGSAITYARRYGLQSFILLPAVDDDGEKATDHNVSQPNAPKTVAVSKDEGYCEEHKCSIVGTISKATGKNYFFCPNIPENKAKQMNIYYKGKPTDGHFIDDPKKQTGDVDMATDEYYDKEEKLEEPNF